jgi:hypothetical protein
MGICPLSQCDLLDLMEQGDCMCLSLAISRSEATIQDPTKLIINAIVPTFMSLDSFMDSSIYNLKKNQDAAGNFDYANQGHLAVGAGNESVSGVMPLFLFQEHWDIAKRKLGPLFGFMCTLDPMGYVQSQMHIIPYLVLLRAIEDVATNPCEYTKKILRLVMQVCTNLVAKNQALKQEIINFANAFIKTPSGRTADVVASIQVLTAQILSLTELPAED